MDTTVITTLLASSLALFGLTLGKDGKVSEFRQQWIDGLRADVAEYLANAHHLFGSSRNPDIVPLPDGAEALQKVNELSTRIRLRLDPKKPLSGRLAANMGALRNVVHNTESDYTDVVQASSAVEETASKLLDEAWERVKQGETRFRIAFWASVVGIVVSVGILSVQSYRARVGQKPAVSSRRHQSVYPFWTPNSIAVPAVPHTTPIQRCYSSYL
jgi:hypothetical protein